MTSQEESPGQVKGYYCNRNLCGTCFSYQNINGLARINVCTDCQARLTQACHLQRHFKTCAKGKTIIDCLNEWVKVLLTPYERVFYNYNKAQTSASSNRCLERKSKLLRKHIHHALCGHDGERWIVGAMVDGYDPTTKTVCQYQRCHWHGCRRCFSNDRDEIINHNQTREMGVRRPKNGRSLLKQATRTYPHAIFYDFEPYLHKTKKNAVTASLTYENAHVAISVRIGDTLKRAPTHICDSNPKELIWKFMEELERRGKNIRAVDRAEFMPADISLLPGKQRRVILEWCDQVAVLGFNCGYYDLNLIKEHFKQLLADTTAKVRVGKRRTRRCS